MFSEHMIHSLIMVSRYLLVNYDYAGLFDRLVPEFVQAG